MVPLKLFTLPLKAHFKVRLTSPSALFLPQFRSTSPSSPHTRKSRFFSMSLSFALFPEYKAYFLAGISPFVLLSYCFLLSLPNIPISLLYHNFY